MKKNMFFRILILILIILITSSFTVIVKASSLSETIEGAKNFIQAGIDDESPSISEGNLKNMSNLLYNSLLVIAIIIAVVVGLVIAIQFMTGSVSEKAKIKETLIPYIAGCVVIFGAFGIWRLVINILSQT